MKVREITKFVQLVNKARIKIQFHCNFKCHNNFTTQYYLPEGSRASQSQEVSDVLLGAVKPTENWLNTCSCLAFLVLYTMHSIYKTWESTMWQTTKNSKITQTDMSAFSHRNWKPHESMGKLYPDKHNGGPLQCSCLESPRDGGTWWAAVYGVAQSQTRLKQLSSIKRNQGKVYRRQLCLEVRRLPWRRDTWTEF